MSEQTQTKESSAKFSLSRLISYQSVLKQIPFFLFMTVIIIIYIYNGHYADKTVRRISESETKLTDLQNQYKSIKGEVMFRSKQSEIIKLVSPLGLKELTDEPYIITDSTQINSQEK